MASKTTEDGQCTVTFDESQFCKFEHKQYTPCFDREFCLGSTFQSRTSHSDLKHDNKTDDDKLKTDNSLKETTNDKLNLNVEESRETPNQTLPDLIPSMFLENKEMEFKMLEYSEPFNQNSNSRVTEPSGTVSERPVVRSKIRTVPIRTAGGQPLNNILNAAEMRNYESSSDESDNESSENEAEAKRHEVATNIKEEVSFADLLSDFISPYPYPYPCATVENPEEYEAEFDCILQSLDKESQDTYLQRFAGRRDKYGFILSPVIESPSPTPSTMSSCSGLSCASAADPLGSFRMSPGPGNCRHELDLSSLRSKTPDWDIDNNQTVPIYQTVHAKRVILVPDGYTWESGDELLSPTGSGEWVVDDTGLSTPPITENTVTPTQFGKRIIGTWKEPANVIQEETEHNDSSSTLTGSDHETDGTVEEADTFVEDNDRQGQGDVVVINMQNSADLAGNGEKSGTDYLDNNEISLKDTLDLFQLEEEILNIQDELNFLKQKNVPNENTSNHHEKETEENYGKSIVRELSDSSGVNVYSLESSLNESHSDFKESIASVNNKLLTKQFTGENDFGNEVRLESVETASSDDDPPDGNSDAEDEYSDTPSDDETVDRCGSPYFVAPSKLTTEHNNCSKNMIDSVEVNEFVSPCPDLQKLDVELSTEDSDSLTSSSQDIIRSEIQNIHENNNLSSHIDVSVRHYTSGDSEDNLENSTGFEKVFLDKIEGGSVDNTGGERTTGRTRKGLVETVEVERNENNNNSPTTYRTLFDLQTDILSDTVGDTWSPPSTNVFETFCQETKNVKEGNSSDIEEHHNNSLQKHKCIRFDKTDKRSTGSEIAKVFEGTSNEPGITRTKINRDQVMKPKFQKAVNKTNDTKAADIGNLERESRSLENQNKGARIREKSPVIKIKVGHLERKGSARSRVKRGFVHDLLGLFDPKTKSQITHTVKKNRVKRVTNSPETHVLKPKEQVIIDSSSTANSSLGFDVHTEDVDIKDKSQTLPFTNSEKEDSEFTVDEESKNDVLSSSFELDSPGDTLQLYADHLREKERVCELISSGEDNINDKEIPVVQTIEPDTTCNKYFRQMEQGDIIIKPSVPIETVRSFKDKHTGDISKSKVPEKSKAKFSFVKDIVRRTNEQSKSLTLDRVSVKEQSKNIPPVKHKTKENDKHSDSDDEILTAKSIVQSFSSSDSEQNTSFSESNQFDTADSLKTEDLVPDKCTMKSNILNVGATVDQAEQAIPRYKQTDEACQTDLFTDLCQMADISSQENVLIEPSADHITMGVPSERIFVSPRNRYKAEEHSHRKMLSDNFKQYGDLSTGLQTHVPNIKRSTKSWRQSASVNRHDGGNRTLDGRKLSGILYNMVSGTDDRINKEPQLTQANFRDRSEAREYNRKASIRRSGSRGLDLYARSRPKCRVERSASDRHTSSNSFCQVPEYLQQYKIQYPPSLSNRLYGSYNRSCDLQRPIESEQPQGNFLREATLEVLGKTFYRSYSSSDCQSAQSEESDNESELTMQYPRSLSYSHDVIDSTASPNILNANSDSRQNTKNNDDFSQTFYNVKTPLSHATPRERIKPELKPITYSKANQPKRKENDFVNVNRCSVVEPATLLTDAQSCKQDINFAEKCFINGSVISETSLNKNEDNCNSSNVCIYCGCCTDECRECRNEDVTGCVRQDNWSVKMKNDFCRKKLGVREPATITSNEVSHLCTAMNNVQLSTEAKSAQGDIHLHGINDIPPQGGTNNINSKPLSPGKAFLSNSQHKEVDKQPPLGENARNNVSVVLQTPGYQRVLEDEKGKLKLWPYSDIDNIDKLPVTLHRVKKGINVPVGRGMSESKMTVIQSAEHSAQNTENKMMKRYHTSSVVPGEAGGDSIMKVHGDSVQSVLLQDSNGNALSEEELASVLPKIADTISKLDNTEAQEILPGITQSITKLKNGGNLVITTMTRKLDEDESVSSGRATPDQASSEGPVLSIDDIENSKLYLVRDSQGELFYVEDITEESQESAYFSSSRGSESGSSPTLDRSFSNMQSVGNGGIQGSTANEILSAMYGADGIQEINENEEEWSERTYEYDRSVPRRDSFKPQYMVEEPETLPRASANYALAPYQMMNVPMVFDGGLAQSYSQMTQGTAEDNMSMMSAANAGGAAGKTIERYTLEGEIIDYPIVPPPPPQIYIPPPPVVVPTSLPLVKVTVPATTKDESTMAVLEPPPKVEEQQIIYKTVAHIQPKEKLPAPKKEVEERKTYKVVTTKAAEIEEKEAHMNFEDVSYQYHSENIQQAAPAVAQTQYFVRSSTNVEAPATFRTEKKVELAKQSDQTYKSEIQVKDTRKETVEQSSYSYDEMRTHLAQSGGDMRVVRGSYLIKNSLDDAYGYLDDNINMFDGKFELCKDNPLYKSEEDLYSKTERSEKSQKHARSQRSHSQDLTFQTRDKYSKTKNGKFLWFV